MAITALLILFAVINRDFIDISLFPLPYTITLPKFLLAIICFAGGLLVGGLMMSLKMGRIRRSYKQDSKRASALENEVKALHIDNHVLPN